jgi:hypothetical protein
METPFKEWYRNLYRGLGLAFLFPVPAERFAATPLALAFLAISDFLLNLIVSFLLVGRAGSFAYAAVTSFYFHLPLFLFYGYLASRLLDRPVVTLAVPVALVAVSLPIELCHAILERLSQLKSLGWMEDYLYVPHYYRFYLWWLTAALVFLLRMKGVRFARRLAAALLFVVLVAAPLWFFSRGDLWVSGAVCESGELHLTDEVLAAQQRLLDGELAALLPGRKGTANLYFVGFAGDASQDVFLKEVNAAQRLFEQRFGTFGRSVVLANNPRTATRIPFATVDNLGRTLARIGQVMNRDEDVLFLYLTSHGSREHELAVNNYPLELAGVTPETVRNQLRKSGIVWRVVVVSACYAGGFVEPLKDDHTLVITAADATHESFGCGFGEKFTWFGEAFVDDALRDTFSFTEAFELANQTIREWETEQHETPSNPQLWVGKEMERKLAVLARELESRSKRFGKRR